MNLDAKLVTHPTQDPNALVYDFGDDEDITKEGLPDVTKILDAVIQVLECMATPEMQLLKTTNKATFEQVMEERFPSFSDEYYSVFKMILSGEDITPLFAMLGVIQNITSDKISLEDGKKTVGKYLNKFLPKELLDGLKQ